MAFWPVSPPKPAYTTATGLLPLALAAAVLRASKETEPPERITAITGFLLAIAARTSSACLPGRPIVLRSWPSPPVFPAPSLSVTFSPIARMMVSEAAIAAVTAGVTGLAGVSHGTEAEPLPHPLATCSVTAGARLASN